MLAGLFGVAALLAGCRSLPPVTPEAPLARAGEVSAPVSPAISLKNLQSRKTSRLFPLENGRDALAARLDLADHAKQSLDVQYFIWNNDSAGKVLLEHLLRAADRGVQVRVLLDDIGTMPGDDLLLAVDSHPNLEIRMFNPVHWRRLRLLGILSEFGRVNRRMHNKSWIADGRTVILGGRNIGDEYFSADSESNFADLDVMATGPVVEEATAAFTLYWQHPAAVPMSRLAGPYKAGAGDLAGKRKTLARNYTAAKQVLSATDSRQVRLARNYSKGDPGWYESPATIVQDHPDKILLSSPGSASDLAPTLRALMDAARHEVFLVSPYFVPGKHGVALLAAVRKRGVRVVVVTNSLASTDGIAVHSGYQDYRRDVLKLGIELYEMKPGAGNAAIRAGTAGLGLHAKTFSFDRRFGFIGSYNLDPRSSRLNTEMGVLFHSPGLASRLPLNIGTNLHRTAWRVKLEDNQLRWVSGAGDQEVVLRSEPEAGAWKKFKMRVLSWLPIESLL